MRYRQNNFKYQSRLGSIFNPNINMFKNVPIFYLECQYCPSNIDVWDQDQTNVNLLILIEIFQTFNNFSLSHFLDFLTCVDTKPSRKFQSILKKSHLCVDFNELSLNTLFHFLFFSECWYPMNKIVHPLNCFYIH